MQTNDAEAVGQIAALESVVSALQGLEGIVVMEQAEYIKALENFAEGKRLLELGKLFEEQRSEFDALDFIGQMRLGSGRSLWSREEFHSGVLAWLLDPNQSHGISDKFLSGFLTHAGVQIAEHSSDWSAASVQQEWPNEVDGERGSLDILILDESKRTLCAIENKVFSSEHSEQLTRYRKALAVSYPDFTRHHVFLTRGGTLPNRQEERASWVPATYVTVLNILQQITDDNSDSVKEDVRAFLRQYTATLRRNIVPDTSIAQLARKIYLEHRDAIEQIIKHKPDYFEEVRESLKEAVAQQEGWTLVPQNDTPDLICFLPDVLEEFEVLKVGKWVPNHLLWFEFGCIDKGNDVGKAWFQIELAPAPNKGKAVREKIIETFRRRDDLFQNETEYDGGGMRWEAPDWLIKDADLGIDWDDGIVYNRVNQFASNEFPRILEVVVNCLREYEA